MVEEYPRNLMGLEANFGTDAACRAYLARLRWPTGFACPRCRSAKAWPVRDLWKCGGCGCQTDFGDRRDDFSRYADPFAGVVPGLVVGDDPEERRQRIGSAARARAEEIRDGLGRGCTNPDALW